MSLQEKGSQEYQPPLYPVFLDLRGRLVVVVGAGAVALRKVRTLAEAGACVRVVAPNAMQLEERLGKSFRILTVERPFEPDDLAGACLVFAATDSPSVNEEVARLARERGIFVNVADAPPLCTAWIPASFCRGENVQVAVSTRGASPRLAALLRGRLEVLVGPEWAGVARLLAALRGWWDPLAKKVGLVQAERQQVWQKIVIDDLPERFAALGGETLEAQLRCEMEQLLVASVENKREQKP